LTVPSSAALVQRSKGLPPTTKAHGTPNALRSSKGGSMSFHKLGSVLLMLSAAQIAIAACSGGGSGPAPDIKDTKPPGIASSVPSSGAAGVAVNAPVVIVFAEPVDAASVNANTVRLTAGATALAATYGIQ